MTAPLPPIIITPCKAWSGSYLCRRTNWPGRLPWEELIALVDSLRNGSLTPSQTEVVWTLRSGLTLLAEKEEQDVKMLRQEPVQV
jgi:hypothetical protein